MTKSLIPLDESRKPMDLFFLCVLTNRWPEACQVAREHLGALHDNAECCKILGINHANQLGIAFLQLEDYDRALIWYRMAWSKLPPKGEYQMRGIILANLAEVSCLREDGSQVDELLDQAEAALAMIGPIAPQFASGALEMRAYSARLRLDYSLAEKHLLAALNIAHQCSLKEQEESLRGQLSALYACKEDAETRPAGKRSGSS